jgi:hypothetical protein
MRSHGIPSEDEGSSLFQLPSGSRNSGQGFAILGALYIVRDSQNAVSSKVLYSQCVQVESGFDAGDE